MGIQSALKEIQDSQLGESTGSVLKVKTDTVLLSLPEAKIGALCEVDAGNRKVMVQIVSLDKDGHVAMPLDTLEGVKLGAAVHLKEEAALVRVGQSLLGQVVDSLCRPYEDSKKGLVLGQGVPLYGEPVNPLDREIISDPIDLGVRSINACLTCGKGQRQGIFAGSGVGKSVLLGMISRYTSADIIVIALIGERGREVKEFIEKELDPETRKRCVVVVETADKSAVRRSRGAAAASSIAEFFRKQGKDVLLLMDSLTRFAMAQREIAIAAGEPPATKGYSPSVFGALSRLVERAGNWGEEGSITGLYTVLVEGDDMEDPVADNCRAYLDGHIVLSRRLANQGHYPAVDVVSSVSRVMDQVVEKNQLLAARSLKESLARFQENEDAIRYGAYVRGTDTAVDEAIERSSAITGFLKQDREESVSFSNAKDQLLELFDLHS
ncbi:MAG: FliI/YscN family ATPase [Bdellovibrionota bacterium]